MMKLPLWIASALMLFALPFVAEIAVAQFPPPPARSTSAPQATQQAAPPAVAVPPSVAVSPAAPAAAGWTQDDFLKWLAAAIGTIATAIFGKNSFWPKPAPAAPASPATPVMFQPATSVSELLSRIQDPAKRKEADELMLQLVLSGLPGMFVQAGLSAIPNVGPTLAQLEPALRRIIEDVLAKRGAANQ